jgi:hypothetical protein
MGKIILHITDTQEKLFEIDRDDIEKILVAGIQNKLAVIAADSNGMSKRIIKTAMESILAMNDISVPKGQDVFEYVGVLLLSSMLNGLEETGLHLPAKEVSESGETQEND